MVIPITFWGLFPVAITTTGFVLSLLIKFSLTIESLQKLIIAILTESGAKEVGAETKISLESSPSEILNLYSLYSGLN